MRERHLPGAHWVPAADERDLARRVVRRAKGPLLRGCRDGRREPRDARDRRDLERLFAGRARQQRRQAPGEHGLAGARRAHEDQVVVTRRGELAAAPRGLLPAHVGEVELVRALSGRRVGVAERPRRRELAAPIEVVDDLVEAPRAAHLEAARLRREGRLGGVPGGDDRAAQPAVAGAPQLSEHAAHGAHLARERQLPDQQRLVEAVRRAGARRGEHGDGDREVEGRAVLLQVRGREAQQDVPRRQLVALVRDRGAHPHAALFDGGFG